MKGNVVLVACEFNVWSRNEYAQWSRAKAEAILGLFEPPELPVGKHPSLEAALEARRRQHSDP